MQEWIIYFNKQFRCVENTTHARRAGEVEKKRECMELPDILKSAIEKQIEGLKHVQLAQDAQALSLRYRTESGSGKRLLTHDNEAAAYSVVRMPATYGAVFTALKHSINLIDTSPTSLLDVGAGTGAASWAAVSLIDLKSAVCLEREEAMCRIGQKLMSGAPAPLDDAKWIRQDLLTEDINEKADLVIVSYVLNEMTDDERANVIFKLWNSTNMYLLIVEPGTPAGFSQMIKTRSILLKKGAHIVAPCPHETDCGIAHGDWCHFSCRVPRSRLHRQLKDGDVPYEDEKFTYLFLSKNVARQANARILRHPYIGKGQVTLDVCSHDGISKIKLHKKDGDLYKTARKSKWGDAIHFAVLPRC